MGSRQFRERRRPFLTARWTNPVLLTFEAPKELLSHHLPRSLEPDLWQDLAHVSLVAFDFQDTRLRGRRIPGFVDFPQLNLRTYVRQGGSRGVFYLKEYVPSKVVAAVARLRFNEPYSALAMTSHTEGLPDGIRVRHEWHTGSAEQHLDIVGEMTSVIPPDDGPVFHFTEHRVGFGVSRRGSVVSYRIEHPTWGVRQIKKLDYHIDCGALFGEEWSWLDDREPSRTTFAVGSRVAVFPPGR